MAKILVTGGFGFIGHTLVKKLLDKGNSVHVVDNANTYNSFSKEFTNLLYSERLKHLKIMSSSLDTGKLKIKNSTRYSSLININNVITANLELSDVREAVVDNDYDVIYHLAGYPRQAETKENTFEAADIHARGLLNILHNQINLKRIIYFSTSMVYGDFEDYVTERQQPNPQSLYGFMRLIGERTIMQYCKQNHISWNIIRPCTVYGERDTHNRVLGRFMWRAVNHKPLVINGANVILDFTHVDDVVQGCVKLLDAVFENRCANEIFNFSHSKVKYTIQYLADLIIETTGVNTGIEIRNPDTAFPKRSVMCIDKARHLLEFEPEISLEEGVKITWNWYQSSTAMQHADTNR